jgi:phosphatidylethanolamine/phosphatidyl-N-methylethanolamine N-methyltransferase
LNLGSLNTSDQLGPARNSSNILTYALFLREYVRNPRRTASLCPSSPVLSRRLADCIDFSKARAIVDLGAGTGAVTRAILDRLPSDGKLYAVDNNRSFVEHLNQAFPDSRLVPVHAQANALAPTLRSLGAGRVDAIVSSLGLTSMAPTVRRQILKHAASCLAQDGVFIQYQYLTSRWSWLNVKTTSHWPFEAEQLLRTFFGTVITQDVLLNIPPARIFLCSEPSRRVGRQVI